MMSLRLANCSVFHTATGNARMLRVDSRVDRTSNTEVDYDRRRCRVAILATG